MEDGRLLHHARHSSTARSAAAAAALTDALDGQGVSQDARCLCEHSLQGPLLADIVVVACGFVVLE
jgi:hypothetical protein